MKTTYYRYYFDDGSVLVGRKNPKHITAATQFGFPPQKLGSIPVRSEEITEEEYNREKELFTTPGVLSNIRQHTIRK